MHLISRNTVNIGVQIGIEIESLYSHENLEYLKAIEFKPINNKYYDLDVGVNANFSHGLPLGKYNTIGHHIKTYRYIEVQGTINGEKCNLRYTRVSVVNILGQFEFRYNTMNKNIYNNITNRLHNMSNIKSNKSKYAKLIIYLDRLYGAIFNNEIEDKRVPILLDDYDFLKINRRYYGGYLNDGIFWKQGGFK